MKNNYHAFMCAYSCFKYNVVICIAVLTILNVSGRSKVECQDGVYVSSQNFLVATPPKVICFL